MTADYHFPERQHTVFHRTFYFPGKNQHSQIPQVSKQKAKLVSAASVAGGAPKPWLIKIHGVWSVSRAKGPFTQDAEVLANAACKKWNTLFPMGVFTQHCRQHQRICPQICVQTCLCVLCERGLRDKTARGSEMRSNHPVSLACEHILHGASWIHAQ